MEFLGDLKQKKCDIIINIEKNEKISLAVVSDNLDTDKVSPL